MEKIDISEEKKGLPPRSPRLLENPTNTTTTTTSGNNVASAEKGGLAIGSSSNDNVEVGSPSKNGTLMDSKRVKRILANRLSAQRSRIKKMHYIAELEQRVSSLQEKIGLLSPQVGYYDNQRLALNVENNAMKQRISSLMHEKLFKDAQFQVLRRDGERLSELYLQQQQQPQEKDDHQQQQQQQDPMMEFPEIDLPRNFNMRTDPLSFIFD